MQNLCPVCGGEGGFSFLSIGLTGFSLGVGGWGEGQGRAGRDLQNYMSIEDL